MKNIFIIFLIALGSVVNAQSLSLHDKGIGPIAIGQVLKKGSEHILPIEKHPQQKHLDRTATRLYNYYFWDSRNLTLGNSVNISNFFIATNKQDTVEAIFLFIPIVDTNKVILLINNAFGDAQLGGSSGAEGQTYRYLTYWYKTGISLFLSQTIGKENIEIYMHAPKMDDRLSPGIFKY